MWSITARPGRIEQSATARNMLNPEIIMKKWIFFLSNSKQVITVGINQIYFFACFSLIYLSDIYINAKYKL